MCISFCVCVEEGRLCGGGGEASFFAECVVVVVVWWWLFGGCWLIGSMESKRKKLAVSGPASLSVQRPDSGQFRLVSSLSDKNAPFSSRCTFLSELAQKKSFLCVFFFFFFFCSLVCSCFIVSCDGHLAK